MNWKRVKAWKLGNKRVRDEFLTNPIGSGWVSVGCPDGSIILQYHRSVLEVPSGEVIDLTDKDRSNRLNADRLWVRTLKLSPDGTVSMDTHGISNAGIPSDESSNLLKVPMEDFIQFMKSYKIKNR